MYRFADIERAVLIAGFTKRNTTGSHNIYLNEKTGLTVTVPNHTQGVSVGVAEKVLRTCVLVARINNINIGSYKHKLTNQIYDYIRSHHAKCKENILFLIPEEVREVKQISTPEQVKAYLDSYKENYKKYNKFFGLAMGM
jgi:predicted RNA binding protein YcfA (HicA-like mRNA interferase family)